MGHTSDYDLTPEDEAEQDRIIAAKRPLTEDELDALRDVLVAGRLLAARTRAS